MPVPIMEALLRARRALERAVTGNTDGGGPAAGPAAAASEAPPVGDVTQVAAEVGGSTEAPTGIGKLEAMFWENVNKCKYNGTVI